MSADVRAPINYPSIFQRQKEAIVCIYHDENYWTASFNDPVLNNLQEPSASIEYARRSWLSDILSKLASVTVKSGHYGHYLCIVKSILISKGVQIWLIELLTITFLFFLGFQCQQRPELGSYKYN